MKLHRLLLGLITLALWTSCQSLYIPNGPNVPLMSEGDELQIGLNVGSNGYGAQLAYSPYYHWAIAATGNTFTVLSGNGRNPDSVAFKHFNGEACTGYYTRLNKFARLEVLAGYGAGQTGIPDDKQLYNKFFVQPSIGISGPWVDAGFTPRLTFVNHQKDIVQGGTVKINDRGTFFEPTLTLRAGFEQFKFQMQGNLAFPLAKTAFTYRKSFLSIGIHLTFVKDFEKYR
jgi:hypothetical protein